MNDEKGGVMAKAEDIVSQYQTTRIRLLGVAYKRIFQLTKESIITLDPSTFSVTNTFAYNSITKISPDDKEKDQFNVEYEKTTYVYKTTYRTKLLCELYHCVVTKIPNKYKSYGPYNAQRLRKNGSRVECKLMAYPYGICEVDAAAGKTMQEYHFVNISRFGTDENAKAVFFEASGRIKIYIVNDLDQLVSGTKLQLALIGLKDLPFVQRQNVQDTANVRKNRYTSTGAAVSVFDVNKTTLRSHRPIPRQMHVTEEYIVEKDASGFQFISYRKVTSIYAIVRSWNNPREFKIEYDDGTSRQYTSSNRDTVISMLLDIAHAVGNIKVIVTGEVSDSLRLMPRFAEEDYQASIKDAFFGSSSIEHWYLSRLGKLCKATTLDSELIEVACKELCANVPCPGISPGSDAVAVKLCLSGVLRNLNAAVVASLSDERLDNARSIVIMLQTLYRIIPCLHGYKSFVEVKEVDTRLLLLQLIRLDNDFVNYWTLEVLMVLCSCPLNPRNSQQEFVNKHTLLTDKMLTCLIDLMSNRIDTENEATEEEANDSKAATNEAAAAADVPKAPEPTPSKVAPNASVTAHLPTMSNTSSKTSNIVERRAKRSDSNVDDGSFFPNSLVIVGAAALLESILSSKRDTSSPELMNKVLDLLSERCEVLIHMLRSTSFLIMENAAILMFILLKNRNSVAPLLRELALSECLVLKHFYSGIFSPSGSQRFISRFLVATWMSGNEKNNPGKHLLKRLLPSGLTEYLKHSSISEEHRRNLDEMEEEFYSTFQGAVRLATKHEKSQGASDLQMRMRKRITTALKEAPVEKVQVKALSQVGEGGSITTVTNNQAGNVIPQLPPLLPASIPPTSAPAAPENFRIMFHVITQDHKLPDLIWNEQTRLELRSALEAELKEFEREQRLRGAKKIAWNYQQYHIVYESLRDEIQVGPIYVRHFLDAGDSFLRSLENPSHVVLFEKLFRRVLVNIERNPRLSVICTKCLARLYEVCRDIIGGFDDMILIARMLDQATNMELQHTLLDLMELLSLEESNLQQLLDKEFVNRIIKYASLAHLNPDQIGNVLARATSNVLMLKDASDAAPSSAPVRGGVDVSEEEKYNIHKRSVWVPDDFATPRVWFAAPNTQIPPPVSAQKGPFHVSELLAKLDNGTINDTWLVAPSVDNGDEENFNQVVDTGRWKPMSEVFQLRMQMLFPGRAVYTPAEIAIKGLILLRNLGAVHKSANSKSIVFYPIPTSKKIMSDMEHLAIFSQLILSNDVKVVEIAANLLSSLVEYNLNANSKLYLTGVFFFACKYTGNNFLPLAMLFECTHLKQSFHDSAASVARDLPVGMRSVLGNILPAALITVLINYGPERFATIFTGDFDTPEVIWNHELRRHVVEMIDVHIGDFPGRLKQHNLARYEYVPIPKIHFQSLDKEIYVHEYYLKNLCDEIRFPDWPIGEPLVLLRECIERWRDEMTKGVVDNSVSEAKKLLGLKERYDNSELRKSYKNLARKYHPDRNPNGREMFEKIHVAYELLASIELQVTETDLNNVVLLINTQNIIYRRFSDDVAAQKYPAYSLLVSVLNLPGPGQQLEGTQANLIIAGTMLMHNTCCVSPLNGKEFVKCNGVAKLYEIFGYALQYFINSNTPSDIYSKLLIYSMKAFMSVSQFDVGQEAIAKLCPKFAEDVYTLLHYYQKVPLAIENALELISRCASLPALQDAFTQAGVIWRLIPMLLAYDGTVEEDFSDENQRAVYNQKASNMHGIVAAKALGRLGGLMFDELASPPNKPIRNALNMLLTQPLAKLLRNRRPWDLLHALNENIEKTTKIWNVGMRKELLDFVLRVDKERKPGTNANELAVINNFSFSSLRNELCVGGVYVRIFIKTAEINEIDDPSQYCLDLLEFIHDFIDTTSASYKNVPIDHQEYAIEGLRVLAEACNYIAHDIPRVDYGIVTLLMIFQKPADSSSFGSAAGLFSVLSTIPQFVQAVCAAEPPCLWRLLNAACTCSGVNTTLIWTAAESFATHPEGLDALLAIGSVPRLLGTIFGIKGFSSIFQSRLSAISLLSKFLWHPIKGSDASFILRQFVPEPLVVLLRSKAGSASLQVLDDVCETPELIWTVEMQNELRSALTALLGSTSDSFNKPIEVGVDYTVSYRQLTNEIYIGGVYIRLFLKQPTFRLSNPVFFLEKLIEFWENSFNTQVPADVKKTSYEKDSYDSKALVLGKEDFISLMTSCIVCVVKGEQSVVDHLLSWGFVHTMTELLCRALDGNRRGTPAISIARILHLLVQRVDVIENLASAPADVIKQLTRLLDAGNVLAGTPGATPALPAESALIVELLKKIFQCTASRSLSLFVQAAMNANLINYVLDHVIGASKEMLMDVRNTSALRIHAVDLLKAIIAADDFNAASLQLLLDSHPNWSEYKDQSHDLFITDQEKTDYFLIQDSSEKKFVGLLTDGGPISLFSSTGNNNTDTADKRASTDGGGAKAVPVKTTQPPVPVPAPVKVAPTTLPPSVPAPVKVVPTSAPVASKGVITTTVTKGELGIGLDLSKTVDGGVVIQKLKEMPAGAINPASLCNPAILPGDLIIGVNGVDCPIFADAVKALKAPEVGSKIVLKLQRN